VATLKGKLTSPYYVCPENSCILPDKMGRWGGLGPPALSFFFPLDRDFRNLAKNMLIRLPPRNFIPTKYTNSNIIYLSLSIFFYKYTGGRTGTGTTGAHWYSLASEKRNLTPAQTKSTNFTYITFICASDCGGTSSVQTISSGSTSSVRVSEEPLSRARSHAFQGHLLLRLPWATDT
jgi:hypothetical protein